MTTEQIKVILKNYRPSLKRLETINMELEKHRTQDQVDTSLSCDPYIKTHLVISGYAPSLEVQMLLKQKADCIKIIKSAVAFVNSIEDIFIKNMFETYYLQGKTKKSWLSIALSYGWKDEQKARSLHNSYLNSLTKHTDRCLNENLLQEGKYKKAG